ncbi:type II toxin-antitoxin system VapC family toxin [Litorihabitans aurantiacus]|uniref:type II toxin-antitoxin system VapC family toxin n=1 Tax=Litorihabitans aurantiacus TaxID=1930061 RepID=UPI0024E124FE|nr:type II toxin-antitoxin system VapC family toxin [Litorihabitans aurantiacus]
MTSAPAAPLVDGDTSAMVTLLISTVLDGVNPTPLSRDQYREAGHYPDPGLRSLDALHLAGALSVEADAVLTSDVRLAAAAQSHGLRVVSPA